MLRDCDLSASDDGMAYWAAVPTESSDGHQYCGGGIDRGPNDSTLECILRNPMPGAPTVHYSGSHEDSALLMHMDVHGIGGGGGTDDYHAGLIIKKSRVPAPEDYHAMSAYDMDMRVGSQVPMYMHTEGPQEQLASTRNGENSDYYWQQQRGEEGHVMMKIPPPTAYAHSVDVSQLYGRRYAGPTLTDIESALMGMGCWEMDGVDVSRRSLLSGEASAELGGESEAGAPTDRTPNNHNHNFNSSSTTAAAAAAASSSSSSSASTYDNITHPTRKVENTTNVTQAVKNLGKSAKAHPCWDSSNWRLRLLKRSNLEPKYTVKVGTESEAINDGYKWRKYGQKNIKNCSFPRSYYKCSAANCNAKKQIERKHEDPQLFLVTYEGLHIHLRPHPLRKMQ